MVPAHPCFILLSSTGLSLALGTHQLQVTIFLLKSLPGTRFLYPDDCPRRHPSGLSPNVPSSWTCLPTTFILTLKSFARHSARFFPCIVNLVTVLARVFAYLLIVSSPQKNISSMRAGALLLLFISVFPEPGSQSEAQCQHILGTGPWLPIVKWMLTF